MYPSTYGHFSSGDLLEPRNTTPGDDASLGRCQRTNQKNEKKRNRKRKRSQVANDGNLEGKSSIRCRARSEVYSSARWSLWLSLHFETEAPPQIRGGCSTPSLLLLLISIIFSYISSSSFYTWGLHVCGWRTSHCVRIPILQEEKKGRKKKQIVF